MSVSAKGLLILLLLTMLNTVVATPLCTASVFVEEPSLRSICDFIASLYTDLAPGYGCVRESPVVEKDVCYTSTNLLAEYVLRSLCGNKVLADRVKAFLKAYPTDFYDYYQVIFSKQFTLPFTVVEHEVVAVVGNTTIKHVKRVDRVVQDYDQYANLLALKALYHIVHGQGGDAVAELTKLSALFDGYGFRDKAYNTSGKYETYKLALAIIVCKCLWLPEAEEYTTALYSIKPFTTLHTVGYRGRGNLNLEAACLAAIALYAPTPCNMSLKLSANLAVLVLHTEIAVALAALVVLKLLRGSAKPNLKAKWGVLVVTSLTYMDMSVAKQFK